MSAGHSMDCVFYFPGLLCPQSLLDTRRSSSIDTVGILGVGKRTFVAVKEAVTVPSVHMAAHVSGCKEQDQRQSGSRQQKLACVSKLVPDSARCCRLTKGLGAVCLSLQGEGLARPKWCRRSVAIIPRGLCRGIDGHCALEDDGARVVSMWRLRRFTYRLEADG